jgi:predicted nucleic acid-binding protein
VAQEAVAFVNASPLIGLAQIDGLAWLRRLYGRASMTPTVRAEVLTGLGRPGEAEVSAAIRRRQLSILRRDPEGPPFPALDDGEASTVRAALAHGPRALVILDELSARKTARRLGLPAREQVSS